MDCTRLDSLLVTSLIWAPRKQHASLDSASGRQMGASVPLRRESPTTITHRLFLVALVVIWGADRAALLSSSASPDVTGLCSLQSGEAVLQGHLRLWVKSLPPAGPCCCKLPFFCIIGPRPICVCWWGSFWLFGHGLWVSAAEWLTLYPLLHRQWQKR